MNWWPFVPAAVAAPCVADSGPQRAVVIELFTSEGCSSCPPADRWLSGFVGKTAAARPIVPLAFHVDYWDHLGWRDRFGSPRFTERQYRHVKAVHGRFAYTPQTVIDGRDSTRWRRAGPGELAMVASPPPVVDLRLALERDARGRIDARLDVRSSPDQAAAEAVVWLALYENGLRSAVAAGENAGRELRHDFVVRAWEGPFALAGGSGEGATRIARTFDRPDVAAGNAGVAAIVETADGRDVLQAIALPLCL